MIFFREIFSFGKKLCIIFFFFVKSQIDQFFSSFFFLLSSGAFSRVYAGVDKDTGKEVAIKVMSKENIKEKQVFFFFFLFLIFDLSTFN